MKYNVRKHAVVQPLDQSIKLIPLTRGHNAIVDASDYDWLMEWNWQATGRKPYFYASRYHERDVVYMHREIMRCDSEQLDHWNHDTLDNRRQNLRPATVGQNQANRRIASDNKCGLKGVHREKISKKWIAQATAKGVRINLGCYDTPEAAHAAYCAFARATWGEFAFVG